MAAVFLHNALHGQDSSSSSFTSSTPVTRHTSTFSTATLHASISEFSQPTEPLLPSNTLDSVADPDLSSRKPVRQSGSPPGWMAGLSSDGDAVTPRLRNRQEHLTRRRLRHLKYAKIFVEIVMALWAVYNTIRYFLVYMKYQHQDGRSVALILGITCSASTIFFLSAWTTSVLRPLVIHPVRSRNLLMAGAAFHSVAAFLLISPAIVNLVMLFVWKNASVSELNVQRHCHLDIDAIWSASNSDCTPPPWWLWVALSVLRLVLTICIVILYHLIAANYHRLRQTSAARSRRSRHSRSMSSDMSQSALPPYMTGLSTSSVVIPPRHTFQHKSSDSTLQSTPNSKKSSKPGTSSGYSDDDHFAENLYETHSQFGTVVGQDRFQSLISQITRETEDGVSLAMSPEPSPTMDLFNPPSYRPPTLGYDEFGRPYPPDETLMVMNGLVRRMPTIESMGSRELGTASSVSHRRDSAPLSIPDTPLSSRANTMSVSDYGTPLYSHSRGHSRSNSRNNSLPSGAEAIMSMGRASEVGELVDYGDSRSGTTRTGTGTDSSYPSSISYYTASSNRSGPQSPQQQSSQTSA